MDVEQPVTTFLDAAQVLARYQRVQTAADGAVQVIWPLPAATQAQLEAALALARQAAADQTLHSQRPEPGWPQVVAWLQLVEVVLGVDGLSASWRAGTVDATQARQAIEQGLTACEDQWAAAADERARIAAGWSR
jgi:hypothetical protein